MTKSRKPWDYPDPFPTTGEPTKEAIYTAVGNALTQWERAQFTALFLFSRMSGASWEASISIYHGQDSSSGKHRLILAAASAFFQKSQPHLDYVKELIKIADQCAGRRNDIAHGICGGTEKNGYRLLGAIHSKRGFNWQTSELVYALDATNINDYGACFTALYDEFNAARKQLFGAKPDTFPETLLTPCLPPAVQALRSGLTNKSPLPPLGSSPASPRPRRGKKLQVP